MADERLLAAIRRYWTREEVDTAYKAIFAAYYNRQSTEVTIIGVSFEGESSSGQVTIQREDFLDWMDALETMLSELDAGSAGESLAPAGAPISNYNRRSVDP